MARVTVQTHIVPPATFLLLRSIFCAALCASTAVCILAKSPQQSSADESWTATIDTSVVHGNPSRTTESHTKSGDRTIDKRKIEVLGLNGRYQPFSETETETVQVDAATARTVVRTYNWDGNGRRTLAEVTEEESRTTASGDTRTERKTSKSDLNGNVQVAEREIVNARKVNPAVEATKTTVYRADSYGGFTQAQQTHELKTHNADDSVEVKKTTLVPDGNGNWKVSDVTETTITDDGKNRTTEERLSRPDIEGRLLKTSRILAKEKQTATGERRSTVETYSLFAPGYFDSSLHLHQRVTTVERKDPGRETSQQQIEQPSAGNPSDGPKVTARTKYVVQYAATGTESKETVEVRDANGKFNTISIKTQKSIQTSFPQASPALRDKP